MNTALNKKYPVEAKNCLECVWYSDDSGHIKHCLLHGFNNMIAEFKNCDRGC